ncbi:hypothetical protein L6452_35484 [Arctium lappa]|uniref:Uncharacterized protein n=1 Tax=Arctium lappa TaxID=4217 RepID=A0ACB8Y799_ARCLA|nr:hypothetical protein L6452_35484 [Arctium lappa]
MASLVLLLSELLKHHDAEFGNISSSSKPSSFSGGAATVAGGGGSSSGSCATAKRVTGKSLRNGVGGYRREEDFVVDEAELRVCVEFV